MNASGTDLTAAGSSSLRVVVLKPGKYDTDGHVQRFRRGFMPNSTVSYLASLTPSTVDGARCEVVTVDEYVHTDLDYLDLLARDPNRRTLLALAGVQSHQFQRALDLAALARSRGVENVVIGGPHPMTCDTLELQGRRVSFSRAPDASRCSSESNRSIATRGAHKFQKQRHVGHFQRTG